MDDESGDDENGLTIWHWQVNEEVPLLRFYRNTHRDRQTDRQTDRWLLQWYCMQARRHDATATRLRASRPVICVSRRHSASASRDWRQMALLYARHTAAPSRYRKWSTAHARDLCRLVPVSPARCRCCCVVTRTCATTAATSVMLWLHLVSVYKKTTEVLPENSSRTYSTEGVDNDVSEPNLGKLGVTEIGRSAAELWLKTIFNMAAVRHLGLKNHNFGHVTVIKFHGKYAVVYRISSKSDDFFVEIWRFNEFQDGRYAPSGILWV